MKEKHNEKPLNQPLDHFKKARLAYFQGVASLADIRVYNSKKDLQNDQ